MENIRVSRSKPVEAFVTDEISTNEEFDVDIADEDTEAIIDETAED